MEKEKKKQLDEIKRKEIEAQLRENELKLQKQCDEMFNKRPIPFNPRPGVKLDEKIADIIKTKNIKSPVEWIKGNNYLIGTQKSICELKVENVVVRSGGGYERFESMVPKNDQHYQQTLISHMLNTQQSLPWVVDQLKQGKLKSQSVAVLARSKSPSRSIPRAISPTRTTKNLKGNNNKMIGIPSTGYI